MGCLQSYKQVREYSKKASQHLMYGGGAENRTPVQSKS